MFLVILNTQINGFLEVDEIIWALSPSGKFTSKLGYRSMCKVGNKSKWRNIIWGTWVPPKYSFLAWQVCSDALKMQDRLRNCNIIDHSRCSLCNRSDENTRHLYFNCPYSKEVWGSIKQQIGMPRNVEASEREWHLILKNCKGKSQVKEVFKALLCATLYGIWRERNQRVHGKPESSAEVVTREIARKIKKHLAVVVKNMRDSVKAREICQLLRISPV